MMRKTLTLPALLGALTFAAADAAAECPMGASPVDVNATYGALPDDGRDDTAALQAALDAAMGQFDCLQLEPGVYDVGQTLQLREAMRGGVAIDGPGAELRGSGDFTVLSTGSWMYPEPGDALLVDGLRIAPQPGTTTPAVFMHGRPNASALPAAEAPADYAACATYDGRIDRLAVDLVDVVIEGSGRQAAIQAGSLVDLVLDGVQVSGPYEYGLYIHGDRTNVTVPQGFVALQSEYGLFAANGGRRICADITGAVFGGGLLAAVGEGSYIGGSDITTLRPPFYLEARDSKVDIAASYFRTGVGKGYSSGLVYYPEDVTFTDTTFTVAPGSTSSVRVLWTAGPTVTGQRLTFERCTFGGGTAEHAVFVQAGSASAHDNRLNIVDGSMGDNHTYSVFMEQGGAMDITRLSVPESSLFLHEVGSNDCDVTLTDVPFDPAENCIEGSACTPNRGLGLCAPEVVQSGAARAAAAMGDGAGGGGAGGIGCMPICEGYARDEYCMPGMPGFGANWPMTWACASTASSGAGCGASPTCATVFGGGFETCALTVYGTACVAQLVGGGWSCNHCVPPR